MEGKESGVYVEAQTGTLMYFRRYVGGRVAATMMVVMVPVFKGKDSKHIVAEIHSMFTKKQHRRKGYMSEVLSAVLGSMQGEVKFAVTNWNDSSKEGRAFLLKRGFERQGVSLFWKRQ